MIKLPEGTAAAFNQWMQDFIDNPEGYEREWESIHEFLSTSDGVAPDYGQSCVALLERLLADQGVASIGDSQPAAQSAAATS